MSFNLSARKANPEQEIAIFHRGGKLLSAGAGSGKTFVLIEHLIFLLTEVKHSSPREEWAERVSSTLAKTVLMTFTKKAAGEMSVRMMRKVEELILEAETNDQERELGYWIVVRQNLSYLNITTIHGFCHKILSMGFWTEFPAQINLVSEIEHREKIQKLFDRWFEQKVSNLNPVFLAGTQALLSAMKDIFASPELRVLWSDPKMPQSAKGEIDHFFKELQAVKGYDQFFQNSFDLLIDPKEAKKKWYELYIQFNDLKLRHGSLNFENYLSYHNFFKAISRFPPSSKEMSSAQVEAYEKMKELRSDLKNAVDDLCALSSDFETYRLWVETIADIFQYIDRHYFEVEGFSFSDLEFYTLRALKKDEVLSKIQDSYSYFIVDEFQDTSFIQFEILKKLIGKHKDRLFCVGDRKQAIYGFRGGELQVFADCAQMLGEKNNYILKNNFRSFSAIINYNNKLFETVFPLGLKYEGHDPHGVEMEAQHVPELKSNLGSVVSLKTIVLGDSKEIDLDKVEADVLCRHIIELLHCDQNQSICVLYRKLKPSTFLLEEFLRHDISFSAQVKIDFSEDPILVLFVYLVELELHKQDEKKSSATMTLIKSLFEVLHVDFNPMAMQQFHFDVQMLGLKLAFHKYIFSLGLSNSFYAQNSSVVDSVCKLAMERPADVYNLIKSEEGQYACEMMSGTTEEGKKRILIMSAHASKGLEFDAVLLGGVHTNGRYLGMKDHIGKFPHSFKWKKETNQKVFFKSPFYHVESETLKLKDFSESKRLLYVACTRAVKQLVFANLFQDKSGELKGLHESDNSWIHALRMIPVDEKHYTVSPLSSQAGERALIQQDWLGLLPQKISNHLGIIAELSVTRLATIAECPHKFYLQNICKIEVEEPSTLFVDEEEVVFFSSKKRGTEIHSYLSQLFSNQISLNELPIKEKEKLSWAFEAGLDLRNQGTEIISEIPVKFSFFGQMISGTPDLVFLSDGKIVIWDFKTGLRDPNGEAGYWFQLGSYAFAYAQMKHFKQTEEVEMSLLYVDQKELVSKKMTLNQLTQLLFDYWKMTESLNQMNLQHCFQCEFSSICAKGAISPLN